MQPLRSETKEILAEVEKISGKPVRFFRDDALPLLTTIQMARNGASFHILRHKPSNEPLDYFVAYQAAFALRLFANPAEARFDFVPTSVGASALEGLITASAALNELDRKALALFVATIHQWALLQLRSLPIGMRIDCWIADNHAGLKDLQATGIAILQQQNVDILSRQLGNLAIPLHLLGTCAAYALLADRLLGIDRFIIPYSAAGLLDYGQELLAIWQDVPADAAHDCELVDRWAQQLGMTDWYRWVPYKP